MKRGRNPFGVVERRAYIEGPDAYGYKVTLRAVGKDGKLRFVTATNHRTHEAALDYARRKGYPIYEDLVGFGPKRANPTQGIQFILGIDRKRPGPRGGVTEVQSVLFDRRKWTPSAAKKWLQAHDLKSGLEEWKNTLRARQTDPRSYEDFRTVPAGGLDASNPAIIPTKGGYRLLGATDPTLMFQQPGGGKPTPQQLAKAIKEGAKAAGLEIRTYAGLREATSAERRGSVENPSAFEAGEALAKKDRAVRYNRGRDSFLRAFRKDFPRQARDKTLLAEYERGYAAGLEGRKMWSEANPAQTAAELSEDFHGRPPKETIDTTEAEKYRSDLAVIGKLIELQVLSKNFKSIIPIHFSMRPRPTLVCVAPETHTLYFEGGDQSLSLGAFGIQVVKDEIPLGECYSICYRTDKHHLQDSNGSDEDYDHKFAEKGGTRPLLVYDSLNKRLELVGGSYKVKDVGIVG